MLCHSCCFLAYNSPINVIHLRLPNENRFSCVTFLDGFNDFVSVSFQLVLNSFRMDAKTRNKIKVSYSLHNCPSVQFLSIYSCKLQKKKVKLTFVQRPNKHLSYKISLINKKHRLLLSSIGCSFNLLIISRRDSYLFCLYMDNGHASNLLFHP